MTRSYEVFSNVFQFAVATNDEDSDESYDIEVSFAIDDDDESTDES